MKDKVNGTYYRKGGLLWLATLLGSTLGWAQQAEVVLNDLAFVLGDAAGQFSNRSQLHDALHTFSERHALGVSLTLLEEDQLYQADARQQETQRLQQATPVLVITSWHDRDTKARSRTQVQVNEAMATRLPQATAEQIIVEALDYYRTNPLSGDALLQGMSLALRRLDAYLDGLPPAGEVPTITFANPATAPPTAPPPGLDQLRYPAHQGNYEQLDVNQTSYPVAWKALPSGRSATVLAQIDQETSFPPGMVFAQNGNSVPSQPGSQTNQQQLTLTGQAHQQEGSVVVYASTKTPNWSASSTPSATTCCPKPWYSLPWIGLLTNTIRKCSKPDKKCSVSSPRREWSSTSPLRTSTPPGAIGTPC